MKTSYMDNDNKKTYKLSIYLLKSEIVDYSESLKESVHIQAEYNFSDSIAVNGKIIIGDTKSHQPNWVGLLKSAVDDEMPELENKSNRAIAFFDIDDRIFVIPFGYGKHLLKDEAIDREFGLKTVLNLVNADKLVSIDKASLSDLTLLTRTQSSRKSKPEAFDIDVIKDLLKSVTGEPTAINNTNLGNIITGNEGVNIIPSIEFADIPNQLRSLKNAFESDRYKKRFGWIDNIKNEKDPAIIEQLRNHLINDLKNKDDEKIHLAPPFLIDWDSFEGFGYTPKGEIETNFEIENFYSVRENDIYDLDWDKLIRLKLYFKYADNEDRHSFNLWRCLNYQTELNNNTYIFTLSKWYKVNKDFHEDIIEYVSQFEESDSVFIDCDEDMDEGDYNEQLAKSQSTYRLLDKQLVQSNISRSGVEVCDVISEDMEFMHVKFRRSSATLSHLFAQGKISAYALRRDKIFRKNLRTKFNQLGLNRELIPLENRQVEASKYTITFVLIERKNRGFIEALPFFSLLNFRLTAEDLILLGYNVKVKKVQIK